MTSIIEILPQELLDAIVDYMNAADRRSLKAFSLTCRTLRPYARSRLFYELNFRYNFFSPQRIAGFRQMCLESPHIPKTFRTLIVSLAYINPTGLAGGYAIPILRLLTNITTLVLTHVPPENLSPYLKSAFSAMPIVNVKFVLVKINSKRDFYEFLNECVPRATLLVLASVTCSNKKEICLPVAKPSALRTLVVSNASESLDALFDPILGGCIGRLDDLQQVNLFVPPEGSQTYARIVEIPSVKIFVMMSVSWASIHDTSPQSGDVGDMALADISHLLTIRVSESLLSWLVESLLKTTTKSFLRRITIFIHSPSWRSISWAALDEAVCQPHLAALSQVDVDVGGYTIDPAVIQELCPLMVRARILQFV